MQPSPAMLRPLAERDLAPIPPGWRTGPPDFVGVGTPKSGSSWWYLNLLRHPGVVPNRAQRKELYAFHHTSWGLAEPGHDARYHRIFARPEGQLVGEWTPSLLSYPFAVEALHRAAPNARCLVLLRNPIDRFVSLYNMHLRQRARLIGATGAGRQVLETHSLFPGAAHACRVADELERLIERFGRDRVLVVQYERARREPEAQIARTYRFLGLDDTFRPDLAQSVNRHAHPLPKPTDAERRNMVAFFEAEVARLADLDLGLDLDLWPEFAAAPSLVARPRVARLPRAVNPARVPREV